MSRRFACLLLFALFIVVGCLATEIESSKKTVTPIKTASGKTKSNEIPKAKHSTGKSDSSAKQQPVPAVKQRSLLSRVTDKLRLTNRRYKSGKELKDKHLEGELKAMGKDSSNETFKGKYKKPLDKHGATTGFFKPDTVTSTSNTAVASSKIGKHLRINPTTADRYATHNDKKGVLSPEVKDAKPMIESKKTKKVKVYKHNLENPKTQKGLAKLQLHDAITGQKDRHGGNIYINTKTGKVTGIDNDYAFVKDVKQVDTPTDRYSGLPQQVDVKHGKRLMREDTQKFKKMLDNETDLDDNQKKNTVERFSAVKKHVKELHQKKMLVGQKGGKYAKGWGKDTYKDAINEPTVKDWEGKDVARSYVQRAHLEQTNTAKYVGSKHKLVDV